MRGIHRAFTKDFCRFMDQHDGWPRLDAFENWLTGKGGQGFKSGWYYDLIKARPVNERYSREVIRYLIENEAYPELLRKRKVLFQFLTEMRVPNPSVLAVKDILAVVCKPSHRKRPKPITGDPWRGGLRLIQEIFQFRRAPWTYVQLLNKDEEHLVRESIQWMFIEVGRSFVGPKLNKERAIQQAESMIGVPVEKYEELALAWWRAEQWTIIRARGQRKSVGMCISLPVNLDLYEEVRRSGRRSHTCHISEFLNPSPDLLAEGLAMRPFEDGSELRGQTRSLFFAVLCQQAYLSSVPGLFRDRPLRVLCPAGTKQNEKRAKWVGYEPTGTFFPGTHIPLMERKLQFSRPRIRSPLDSAAAGAWLQLQVLLRSSQTMHHFHQVRG